MVNELFARAHPCQKASHQTKKPNKHMIKVGILGTETATAGELIRILINHPDVELKTLASDSEAGKPVTSFHRGLIGDTEMTATHESALTAQGHDAVFLCGEPWAATRWMQTNDAPASQDTVRLIDLTGAFRNGEYNMIYGFPEYNRKALVRGATRASVPSAVAMAIELALFPLAKNGLLNGDVQATVHIAGASSNNAQTTAPDIDAAIATSTRLDPIAPIENRPDSEKSAREALGAIQTVQPSFRHNLTVRLSRVSNVSRGMSATVTVPCTVPMAELERLYDETYSDHNFTYRVASAPCVADVANTNKCLLHLAYDTTPDTGLPRLHITCVLDNLLKGSAGTAVHCLNLLFGLSERTGLSLKASAF